jgi:tRNA U34 2-thiouridine synthase MnmA/TrmU
MAFKQKNNPFKNDPFGKGKGKIKKQKPKKGNYNMARALELGYKPDASGHYPSVDEETGMLLKSKKHPTVVKEFISQMHNPNIKLIANPSGYFGADQLQYVSRKKNKKTKRNGVRTKK